MYLCISNHGEIDPRAFSLIGASSKRDASEAIGFFGSGAKYALAVLMREGKTFQVFSGEREINFSFVEERFRDQTVSVIHIDGQPTSLTLETGPKWTLAHAIRELYSNALDEEGGAWAMVEHVLSAPDRTAIYIEVDHDIQSFWKNADKYFISPSAKPLWEGDGVKCYDPAATGGVSNFYRRRVWCCEDRDYEPIYSYDLHNISLNESRVASSYSCVSTSELGNAMRGLQDNTFIENFITNHAHQQCAEWKAMYYAYLDAELWKFVFEQHWQYVALKQDLENFPDKLRHRVKVASQYAFDFFRSIGVMTISDWRTTQEPYTLASWPVGGAEERVQSIIARLQSNGMNYRWPTHYGIFNDEKFVAVADMRKKCVVLSKHAIALGDTELLRTLIEEHVHLDKSVTDGSRQQQNAYLDIIVSLMK